MEGGQLTENGRPAANLVEMESNPVLGPAPILHQGDLENSVTVLTPKNKNAELNHVVAVSPRLVTVNHAKINTHTKVTEKPLMIALRHVLVAAQCLLMPKVDIGVVVVDVDATALMEHRVQENVAVRTAISGIIRTGSMVLTEDGVHMGHGVNAHSSAEEARNHDQDLAIVQSKSRLEKLVLENPQRLVNVQPNHAQNVSMKAVMPSERRDAPLELWPTRRSAFYDVLS